MLNIVISGGPGSGKGTQSDILAETFHLKHLSTGDLLRAEIAKGSELGQTAKSFIDKGNLVPDEMILALLAQAVDQASDANGVIFDGYPRNVSQAAALDKLLADRGQQVTVMLDLVVPDEMLVERMLYRAKTSGRADDNPETIKNRVKVYHEITAPVVEYYQKQGIYHGIDGTKDIQNTSSLLKQQLEKFV